MRDAPELDWLGRWPWRDPPVQKGRPIVGEVSPVRAATGETVAITGANLADVRVRFGLTGAELEYVSDDVVVAVVPETETAGDVAITVENRWGSVRFDGRFELVPTPPTSYVFASAAQRTIQPRNPAGDPQRYLVLMVTATGMPMLITDPAATQAARLRKLFDDDVVSYWEETSHGAVTLAFDVHDDFVTLPADWVEYYRIGRSRTVVGSGATYPVTWSGGERLVLTSNGGFTATVTFAAGAQTLSAVVTTINTAIRARRPTANSSDPIVAGAVGGQLSLRTTAQSDGAKLGHSGSATTALGLTSPTVTAGVTKRERATRMAEEALESRTTSMSASERTAYLARYRGVVVTMPVNSTTAYFRAHATLAGTQLDISGTKRRFDVFWITNAYPWEVFAHEIGHNLGFPDLYDLENDLYGTEVDDWDLMAASWGRYPHLGAWCQTYGVETQKASPWLSATHTVRPPTAGKTVTYEALLVPTAARIPVPNPFAASHPGVPVLHAIRLAVDGARSFYVEARHGGPVTSRTYGDYEYERGLPGNGVVVTDGLTLDPGQRLAFARRAATMVSPYSDPLNRAGERHVEALGPGNDVTVRVVEVLPGDVPVYRVGVTWGAGDYMDLRIDKWKPPPWVSPDIWVDATVENSTDVYYHSDPARNPSIAGSPVLNGDRPRVGSKATVHARVWNDGTRDATDVDVQFRIVRPAGTGAGVPFGQARIPRVSAGGYAVASVPWTPTSHGDEHVCIQAFVKNKADEANRDNNLAQTNVTDWYLARNSPYHPVSIRYQIHNPLPHREDFLLDADGLADGMTLTVERREISLDADERYIGIAHLEAEDWVPLEGEELTAPLVSLSWYVRQTDAWVPVGGVSGTVHTVLRTDLEATLDPTGDGVQVDVEVTNRDGPVDGASVSAHVYGDRGRMATIRGRTDARGHAALFVDRPDGASARTAYELRLYVAPRAGIGPAERRLDVRFVD